MGEEEKKPEEKKMEEKKPEEEKKEEKKAEEKPAEEKKEEAAKDGKESKEAKEAPPPQEIVLKVYMHCEGCARKVRRCLKGFEGVEDVITDCKISKVVVKGEKADPLKVLERVQRKSHRQVELISPIPKPKAEEEKKPEEAEKPKPEEKKEEV
ncbi:heavy metal-associated isoprenylated plant protein 7 [Quercus suber]|uniref:Heavy metal-associated isoprenylated plant protein 7 n=1 Tax=Quercus suber TaxID=58331 RepID=A0AAW0LZ02_QUESU